MRSDKLNISPNTLLALKVRGNVTLKDIIDYAFHEGAFGITEGNEDEDAVAVAVAKALLDAVQGLN